MVVGGSTPASTSFDQALKGSKDYILLEHRSTYRLTHRIARGTKRTCLNEDCGRPFYDLNKTEPVCPECGVSFVIVPPVAARKAKPPRSPSSFARPYSAPGSTIPPPAEEAVLDDVDTKADAAEDAAPDLLLEVDDSDDTEAGEVPRKHDEDAA